MIRELVAHSDFVRVLNALERRPMRFGGLQDELKLHPPQVTRALKFLCESELVTSELADTATGLPLFVYALTDRGFARPPELTLGYFFEIVARDYGKCRWAWAGG